MKVNVNYSDDKIAEREIMRLVRSEEIEKEADIETIDYNKILEARKEINNIKISESVLNHHILLTYDALSEGIDGNAVIREMLKEL